MGYDSERIVLPAFTSRCYTEESYGGSNLCTKRITDALQFISHKNSCSKPVFATFLPAFATLS